MARPKAFDPDLATHEAMEAFWERGYHATSVSDLLTEMKLNRGSLYGTFGDKKRLFLLALEKYDRQVREMLRDILERPGPAKAGIRAWALTVADECSGESGRRGCLACKAVMEVVPHDKDVAEWIRRVNLRNERFLAKVIKRGQAEGQINQELEPRAAARFLLSSVGGMRLLGMTSPSPADVREVVDLVLKVLD